MEAEATRKPVITAENKRRFIMILSGALSKLPQTYGDERCWRLFKFASIACNHDAAGRDAKARRDRSDPRRALRVMDGRPSGRTRYASSGSCAKRSETADVGSAVSGMITDALPAS